MNWFVWFQKTDSDLQAIYELCNPGVPAAQLHVGDMEKVAGIWPGKLAGL